MDGLGREIRKRGASVRILIATLGELQANSIVDCSFLELGGGGHRKLLEPFSPVVNLSSETLLP